MSETKTGVQLIAEERQRQIEKEGWDPEHDSQYQREELAIAGSIYATPEVYRKYADDERPPYENIPIGWPWDAKWWKPVPSDRIRELVKAGALIAAQIDLELSRKEEEML